VRVLRDLADERAPVALGHPVVGLDLELGIDLGLELRELGRILRGGGLAIVLNLQALGVHGATSQRAVGAGEQRPDEVRECITAGADRTAATAVAGHGQGEPQQRARVAAYRAVGMTIVPAFAGLSAH
jgi:hypothetical protein